MNLIKLKALTDMPPLKSRKKYKHPWNIELPQ